MKPKISKFLIASLVLMCILTFALFPQTIAAPATPKISVKPPRNAFRTGTTAVGETFTVNISTSGWEDPGLFAYEFKLYYDPTLLNVTEAVYPPDLFLPPPNFPVAPPPIDYEVGYVNFAVSRMGEVPGCTGSGGLGTITFKIITAPPPDLSCDLELKDIILLDPGGIEITEYDVEHGYYEFTLPKAPVYMKVKPETIGAAAVGQNVRVDITINELRAEDKLFGVEWKLRFNTTLLRLLIPYVTEGDFLRSEAEEAANETGHNYETWIHCVMDPDTDFVYCIATYTRDPYPAEVFPEGSGTLVTITFDAIYMPENLTITDLEIFDVMMLDVDGNEIKYDHIESGEYLAPAELGDLNYDNKINILDLYIFGVTFGSYPGHPRWDSRADLNGDGKVNIMDGIIIAKAFHI